MEIPVNAVTITTTLSVEENGVKKGYMTTIMVQTHKLGEVEAAMKMAWERTCLAYGTDRIMQRKAAADVVKDG